MDQELVASAADADLLSAYVAVKDRYETRDREVAAELKRYKDRMEMIQAELFKRLNERGTDSIKLNGVGTAYRKSKTVASCADWSAFYDWCQSRLDKGEKLGDIMGLLQKRLNNSAIIKTVEESEMSVPGVNLLSTYECVINRA